VANIEHESTRTIAQPQAVVHARLLELAQRLRDELPPVQEGDRAAHLLGVSGPLGVEIGDRGPARIDIATTNGRIRGEGAADLTPTADGGTTLTMQLAIKPQGFAANLMLGMATATIPNFEERFRDVMESGMTDLAHELEKPDGEWDPAAWKPPGLPR
jgi:hypothetical protein